MGLFESGNGLGFFFNLFCGFYEGMGEVDSDDFLAKAGHFVCGASYGAADIESAWDLVLGKVTDDSDGVVEGFARAEFPRKDFLRFGEVEEEVLGEDFVGFVDVHEVRLGIWEQELIQIVARH